MATFIQGVTDTNLDPVLFTPDYSFLRYNLQKKSAQYEQGLKSVSSAYGAMKKELSDPMNVQRRDQYLKNAESELQKIASADLSLQQNVNAANAIFDPIATDPAIAYDAFYTGRIKREMSTMESWASSDDLETRKKFNQDIYNWLKRDLESLKNGNGDVNNYKVQGRKAWAYVDPQDIISKAAKDQGFVIKNDVTGNPYIVTTEGGPANREAYEQFAKSVLRANPIYQQQKQIMGEAREEADLEYVMRNPAYAGMSKDDAYKTLVSDKYTEGRNSEKTYVTALSERLATKTSEYMAYLNKNGAAINSNPQSQEAQTARKMGADLVQFKKDVDQTSADYVGKYGPDDASFEQKRKTFTESFLKNPKAYYANQYDMENMIMFSNIRSSFGTRTIKADQGYLGVLAATNRSLNTLNNIIDDQFDNNMDIEELKLKELGIATKLLGKDRTGQRLKNADGTDKQSDVELIGKSATQVNTVQKINQLREKLEVNRTSAVSALTSTYGGLYLLERMGSKQQEVSLVRGFLSRKAADDNVKPTAQENAALKSVYENMWTWAKQNPEMNQEFLGGLRNNYNKAYKDMDFAGLLRMATKNYVTTDNNDYQAKLNLAKYDHYMQETQRISGLLAQSVDAVVKQVKGDASFRNVLVEENGKTRLIQADDVFKRMPVTGWKEDIDWAIDPNVKLTEQDKRNIAEGIFDGRVKVDVDHYIKTGGKSGDDAGWRYTTTINYQGRKLYIETPSLFSPSSKELDSKLRTINERIPIPVLESEVPGVMVTGSSGFIIRNQAKEDIRVKLAAGATQENSNIMMADGTGTADGYTDVKAGLQDEVRKALANKDNVEQMTLWTNSPLNSGSQVVEVVMASKGGEKAPFWAGQRFFFPVNVNKTSNEVFSVFSQADELDEFMSYSNKNEPYKIDYFEGSGVKAEIVADQPGSKTGRVLLQQKAYDPASGKYVNNWSTKEITFDLNKLTFAEMKQEIFNNFITPYMQGYMNYNRQVAGAVGASGTNLVQQYKNIVTW
jgi:hypothetical protein